MHNHKIRPEDHYWILRCRYQGFSLEAIGEAVGCTRQAIHWFLQEKPNKSRYPSIPAIANLIGCNSSLLYRIRKGKQVCSPAMAIKLDALDIPGWRFADLRPDLMEVVLKAVAHG
jgi:lipid-A-disaccharide synthase-like uncharacterized protein